MASSKFPQCTIKVSQPGSSTVNVKVTKSQFHLPNTTLTKHALWRSGCYSVNFLRFVLKFRLINFCKIFYILFCVKLLSNLHQIVKKNFCCIYFYYAPPSRPEGPRRCPDRGNAGDALVSIQLFWLLYIGCVYLAENSCEQNRIQ